MSEALVEIHNLSKRFSKKQPPSLKNIEANIPKGKIFGLVGADGAGKTTLIRLIAALLTPTEGKIEVLGKDTVHHGDWIHAFSGYMPQKFGLYEDLTVIQNLHLYADLQNLPQTERANVFSKLLSFTGLSPFQKRLAGDLSGGMKQKLGLACALVKKPMLLLLDEPSVGVDPISRRELWKMVYDLLDEGISVIWSTAYLDEAEKCQSILLLNNGELLYSGGPVEITHRVAGRVFIITNIASERRKVLMRLLSEENIIDGVIQGQDLRIVVKNPTPSPIDVALLPKDAIIKPVTARFEDAFIDILGGGPGGKSLLAEKRNHAEKTHEKVISVEGLTKKFGDFVAVNHVNCEVKKGEVFGLLGPNGAGKSTTFKMMCGLLRPTEGRTLINNIDLQKAPGKARAYIGYMAQKFSLYGSLSVRQNLEFFSGIYNLKGKVQKNAIKQMIEVFELQPYLNTSSDLLPLGFKQRLSLACSCMHEPQILFLDEPTSGVDPITRREFWNHINGLVEKGVTILVTTHFMDEAEYCDRIALIYKGQMIKIQTPDELKKMAQTEKNPNPTLEEAFIHHIEDYDATSGK